MTVAQKILFVVSLPVLLCIVIGALAVRHQMNLVRDIQQTALDASATPFASEVVHHLQRERGFTAGFLASRRSGFAEKKDEQRLLTDAAVDKLAAFVQAVPAGFNPDTLESLNKALVMVEEVRALRAQIDENRRVTVAEMAQAYSEVIHHILTGINTSKRVGEIAELQIALREIQQAKEKAGQERAMGSNGLASGSFRPEIYDRFQRLAAQQEIYFAEFFEFAPDRHADALKAAVESETFKRVGEIRQIITKGAFLGNFNGITGLDWFEASSARIELLMDLEKAIVADISAVAVRKVAVARNTAILEVLGLILAVSFFFGVSLFFSSRAIARPARALAVICKDLASGKKIEIPYRDRRDEIGEMARGMDQVVATSQARKRVRAALRNTSAQLMLVSRGHLKYVNPALVATLVDASDDPGMTEKLDDEARLENLPALSKAISECHLVDGRGEVKGFEMLGRRFDLMVAVAMDEDGEDLGIVIEWRDITERRAIEEQLDKVLSAATNGEFSQRVTVQTSDALLASMANGMNAVFDSVEAFVSDLGAAAQALADGDLTRSIEGKYSGQLGVAAQAVTTSVGNLKDLIEAIKQAGEQLDGKSSDLGRNARQLSERTATQAAELEQTNATMNEISRAVTQNAQNTNQADALVNETHDLVSTCLGTMDDAVAAILRIEQGSNAISEIITIIQSIAFQTNLLSLNAAVEAARAGQAGAGFAVVAAEVRALAQRSSDAAKDIDQRIGASVVDVKSGVDLVGQAESSLVSMKEAVDKTVEMIGTINRSNKEQADSIREIQTAITGIDSITQANAEIAAQTAADANEISSNSAGLMGHTGRFQTTRGQSLRRSA